MNAPRSGVVNPTAIGADVPPAASNPPGRAAEASTNGVPSGRNPVGSRTVTRGSLMSRTPTSSGPYTGDDPALVTAASANRVWSCSRNDART